MSGKFFTGRFLIAVVAIVALAGAAVADRQYPPSPPAPAPDTPAQPGGVWVCPLVKIPGVGGYVHLVNTSDERSTVRVTFLPDGRKPMEQALTLGPRHAATVGTPAAIAAQGAGAIVEYAGGTVTVSRTVPIRVAAGIPAAAASCAKPGGADQLVPQGATLQSETQLFVMNPGTADAVVDIALLVNGQEVRPVSLQGRVVPAQSRLIVREGDYAFDARAVSAHLTSVAGRVVSDALVVTGSFADLVPAVDPSRELVALASTARGAATFSTVAVGDDDAVIEAQVLSGAGGTAYPPLTAALAPNTPQVGVVPNAAVTPGAVALVARSMRSAIAIGGRWAVAPPGGKTDGAMASGVSPADTVVAVVGPPANGTALRLLVANPDVNEARLSITLITESGATEPAALQDLALGPGRTTTITFSGIAPAATLGVVVSSSGARIAAALEAIAGLSPILAGYAVTGVPVIVPAPVAVNPDARQGVPAR